VVVEPLCLLDAKPIHEWQDYRVIGLDVPENHVRAHETCVEVNPDRWLELQRLAGER
jgi:hypothetical protein